MDLYLVALFPEIARSFAAASIVGRAVEEGRVRFHEVQIRDFATSRHRTTDDTPYGGGSGMVMMVPPIVTALESLPREPAGALGRPRRVLLTPQGRPFSQSDAQRLAHEPAIAFVCGRYEGVDARVEPYVDEQISIGDYVLTGGEIAAIVIADAVVRLLPGVLGNADSAQTESHSLDGLLEYPQYTRPAEFRDAAVPPVLVSGDHARVARWRRWHSLRRTRERRPDLFARLALDPTEIAWLDGEEPR
jgi:tRNA (guanine37-N1)-methyltransferase